MGTSSRVLGPRCTWTETVSVELLDASTEPAIPSPRAPTIRSRNAARCIAGRHASNTTSRDICLRCLATSQNLGGGIRTPSEESPPNRFSKAAMPEVEPSAVYSWEGRVEERRFALHRGLRSNGASCAREEHGADRGHRTYREAACAGLRAADTDPACVVDVERPDVSWLDAGITRTRRFIDVGAADIACSLLYANAAEAADSQVACNRATGRLRRPVRCRR